MGMKKVAFQIVLPEFFIPARKARGSPGNYGVAGSKVPRDKACTLRTPDPKRAESLLPFTINLV